MATLAWTLALLGGLTALAFFVAWRRARAGQARAEQSAAHAQQARHTADQHLHQQRAQLDALQLAQLEPLLVIAPDRTVQCLNPAASALFGSRAAEDQTLIVVTRSAELDELAAHALAGGEDCDRQITLGGEPYRARAVLVGERGEHGAVLALRNLGELQRLGRARRDFVANISHELRTPITSIRLLVDTLRGPAAEEAEVRGELLEKISVQTETLEQLARELLDLAQIESGQVVLRMIPASVAELATHTIERLEAQAARKRQTITLDLPPELRVLADTDQIDRVLGNLLHNAIKFTPEQGRVWVRAAQSEGDVTIEVGDSGPGIAVQDLPRVFERFFRGDRSRAGGGTGLGLAIAKHVVEAHGGRIWVESEGRLGKGAIFRFTLPAA
jgi:two-component system phosphate regulon sensor histidine kinase PhoR